MDALERDALIAEINELFTQLIRTKKEEVVKHAEELIAARS